MYSCVCWNVCCQSSWAQPGCERNRFIIALELRLATFHSRFTFSTNGAMYFLFCELATLECQLLNDSKWYTWKDHAKDHIWYFITLEFFLLLWKTECYEQLGFFFTMNYERWTFFLCKLFKNYSVNRLYTVILANF